MNSTEIHTHIARTKTALAQNFPSTSRSISWKNHLLASKITCPLDRIRVLGNNENYGHTGCINAVSWAQNGNLLLSGGDDTTVRMWRVDPSEPNEDYPLVCTSVIHTGHSANIFGVQMLPYSTRIATCSFDAQVRVSDVGNGGAISERETPYTTSAANVAALRCHSGSTKRILTEDSPDNFLTVSNDGTVRQHDLRLPPHRCRRSRFSSGQGEGCRPPLVQLRHDLSAIGGSPLAPHQFVVAGEGPYGYLFDRRHAGRFLEAEWGRPLDNDSMTSCVRRFGRRRRGRGEPAGREHVTGARMARNNGYEVLLSYSADAVYLYSIYDEPDEHDSAKSAGSRILSRNRSPKSDTSSQDSRSGPPLPPESGLPHWARQAIEDNEEDFPMMDEISDDESENDESSEEFKEEDGDDHLDGTYDNVPLIYPRARYAGAANVDTVKDVNFVGPRDEFVVSGSDDGNWFIWDKKGESIHGIYEGDGSVVNVIEPHPYLPLIAVSGIDTTVKLFGLRRGSDPSKFSKLSIKDNVVRRNEEAAAQSVAEQADMARFILSYRLARRAGAPGLDEGDCISQ